MVPLLTKILKYKKSGAFLLGLLTVRALPPFYCFPVLLLTLSSLLLLVNSAQTKKSAFNIGYWFGFAYFAANLSWVANALLIDATHLGWLYPITLAAAGAFFGLFTAFPALLSFYFKNLYSRYLTFAATWVIFEWIRSFIFTGFPWNLLGSTLAFNTLLIQSAALIGTYGLSLLVIMFASATALPIYYKNKQSVIISSVVLCSITVFICGYGHHHIKNNPLQNSETIIRLVQPAIPQAMKWNKEQLDNNLKQYVKLSQSEGLDKVDFVIWGETATPYPLDSDPIALQEVMAAIPENGFLITGLVRYLLQDGDFSPLNSMFVIDKKGRIRNHYDKSHLVPFGEYIPLRHFLPDWIRPVTNTIADFVSGNGPKVITLNNHPSFGTLICYEVIFPSKVINKKERPQWIVNLTNDGWYGRSSGPHQHLVTTRLRAVEEGIPIIRAANTGISAVISPLGGIISAISLNEKAYIDAPLPQALEAPSLYGIYGNFIPLILCILNILIAFIMRKQLT